MVNESGKLNFTKIKQTKKTFVALNAWWQEANTQPPKTQDSSPNDKKPAPNPTTCVRNSKNNVKAH